MRITWKVPARRARIGLHISFSVVTPSAAVDSHSEKCCNDERDMQGDVREEVAMYAPNVRKSPCAKLMSLQASVDKRQPDRSEGEGTHRMSSRISVV